MIWIIFILFFGLCFGLMLGRQHVFVQGSWGNNNDIIFAYLDSWKHIAGIQWCRQSDTDLISVRIAKCSIPIWRRSHQKKPSSKIGLTAKTKKKKTRQNLLRFLQKDYRVFIIEAVKDLFSIVHVARGLIKGQVGLRDPASTGILFGLIAAIKPFLGQHLEIKLTPAFMEPRLCGNASISANFVMIQFLLYIIRTAFKWRSINKTSVNSSKGI